MTSDLFTGVKTVLVLPLTATQAGPDRPSPPLYLLLMLAVFPYATLTAHDKKKETQFDKEFKALIPARCFHTITTYVHSNRYLHYKIFYSFDSVVFECKKKEKKKKKSACALSS